MRWIKIKNFKPKESDWLPYNRVEKYMPLIIQDSKRGVTKGKAFLYLEDFDWNKKGDIRFENDSYSLLEVTHIMYDLLPKPSKI